MKHEPNTLAYSMTGLIYALLDDSLIFDKPQLTRQELIDMMQARSPWKGGYDKEWLENIIDSAIEEWEKNINS